MDRLKRDEAKFLAKRCLPFLIMAFFILISWSGSHAQVALEIESKMFKIATPVGSGARALGIGGAFISIADDATAASWNPAGLINLKRPEISIVGSFFSERQEYDTSSVTGEIDDRFNGQLRLNYFSAAFPFVLWSRNWVFSLNYQHLYEFSQNTFYHWTQSIEETFTSIDKTSHERQDGSLSPISPALAIQVIPSLYIGMTANFWSHDLFNNYWESIKTVNGETIALGERRNTFAELYERYDFSGINFHLGFLWKINRALRLGGVLKTPFKASIDYKYSYISATEYPDDMTKNEYNSIEDTEQFKLKMPMSYGLGGSISFSDTYTISLDIYYTQWDDFLMLTPDGNISPINYKSKDESNIKPTIQVRLGMEYLWIRSQRIMPVRGGLFYDPVPAGGRVDDFYGISTGTGLLFEDLIFDIAYQYRFGKKRNAESMLGEEISSDVTQHYFYSSIIYHF